MIDIGKLKKTLKTRCEFCGAMLQLRTISEKTIEFGEEITVDEDFICCPKCGESAVYKKKRDKHREKEA